MGISVKAVSVVKTTVGVKMRKELAYAYAALDSIHFGNRVKKMIRDQEVSEKNETPLTDAQLNKAIVGLKAQAKEDAILINAVATLTLKADPKKISDYEKRNDYQMVAMAGIVEHLQNKAEGRAKKAAATRASNNK